MLPALFTGPMASAQELTALTYNIRYNNPGDGLDRWDLRKDALAQVVLEQDPHIIGFQEVLADQLGFLATELSGYRHFGVGRDDGAEQGEFSPVFYDTTRFALREGRTLWLSETPHTPSKGWDAACVRIATLVVLSDKRTGEDLIVVNTHWDHVGKEARAHSATLILDAIGTALSKGTNVLLMGDLNATPVDAPVALLGEQLRDSCPSAQHAQGTFNGFRSDEAAVDRIDHILLSPGHWRVLRYEVPRPKVNGRQVSDHFPVVVRIAY